MNYTIDSHITTIKEVQLFIRYAVSELGWVEFHPDDSFAAYRKMNPDLVPLYDRLLQECKDVCAAAGRDIYQIGINEVRNYFVKHKD